MRPLPDGLHRTALGFSLAGSSRKIWLALASLTLAWTVSFWLIVPHLAKERPVSPPEVSVPDLDPAVRSLLDQVTAEVRHHGNDARAWGRLGLALRAHGFEREAAFALAQAEARQPSEPRWPYFSSLLLASHQPGASLAKLRRAVSLIAKEPDYPRWQLAERLSEQGRAAEAQSHYQILLETNPSHPLAHLGLARLALAGGAAPLAEAHLKVCLTNAFTARAAHELLTTLHSRLGRADQARQTRRLAQALPPDASWPDPFEAETQELRVGRRAWIEISQTLLFEGRLSELTPVVDRLVKDYPQAPEGWLYLGRLQLLQNHLTGAEQALQRHLTLATNSVDGCIQLGQLRLRQGRNADAEIILQEAVRLKPDAEWAHYQLGLAQDRQGKRAEAITTLRAAIRAQPSFLEAYLALAQIQRQLGDRQQAYQTLQQAFQIHPMDLRLQREIEQLERARLSF